jgi:hypothetical protein
LNGRAFLKNVTDNELFINNVTQHLSPSGSFSL